MTSILQNISNMPDIYDDFNQKWWGDDAMIDEVNICNEKKSDGIRRFKNRR